LRDKYTFNIGAGLTLQDVIIDAQYSNSAVSPTRPA